MSKKVLYGENYTEADLYGVIATMFYACNGHLPRENDVTESMTGYVTTNATTGDVGYIIDSECTYFALLGEPHLSRLVDVVDGDGWMDSNPSET